MRPRSLIPHAPALAFVAATLGFGAGNVLAKVILERGVDPLELLPIRFVVALIGLGAVLALTGKLRPPNVEAWRKGSLLGVINMGGPSIVLTIGLEHLPASVMALLVALLPMTTVAFAHHLIDGETMHSGLLPGFVLALIGSGLLVQGGGGQGDNPILGFILVLLGVTSAGAGGALTRRFALEMPAVALIVPQFVAGAAVVIVAALLTGDISGIRDLDPGTWGLITLLGIVSTTVPFAALLWLSELTTASRVALMAYLVPLVGVAGGVLILGEPVGPRLMIGGGLILVGVVLADRTERRAHAALRI